MIRHLCITIWLTLSTTAFFTGAIAFFMSTAVLFISTSAFVLAADDDCTSADCGEDAEAPYVLRIINSGEGQPRSSNSTPEGQDDNRRVDVRLTRQVPTEKSEAEKQSAYFGSTGRVWLSQDPASLDRILVADAPASASVLNGKPVTEVLFKIDTNYAAYIDQLELLIWADGASEASEPLVVHSLDAALGAQTWNWDLNLPSTKLEPGLIFNYALRASDGDGHIDQTVRRILYIVAPENDGSNTVDGPSLSVNAPNESFDNDFDSVNNGNEIEELERESIPIHGGKVRLLGQDLDPDSDVRVNGELVTVGADGRFGLEYLLPEGEQRFDVVVSNGNEAVLEEELSIDLSSDYFFIVGLADLTVGENKVSGSIEPLAVDDQHYGGDIFVDGRLAFYLKGKVQGKYLVTAQLDTGTEDIKDLFDNFNRKDSSSIFRQLDPDQFYPVYGDDSKLYDDTDSQGKLYVRVDWDRSRVIWGNFNTNFTGTEFAPFNRSLYGAQLLHNSTRDTKLGDPTHAVSVFASTTESLFRHNEFLGTGGSLYYLGDTDIVNGSEKVWVEVRQADTTRVIERVPLVLGRDYDIDNFQGRIILRRPLTSVSAEEGPSIIRDEPLAENQVFLVVDYEFTPANFDFEDTSVGIRAKKWFGDHFGIGGTYADESREGADYNIKGADITLKKSDQTFLKFEFSRSESSQTSGSFLSNDGGLTFETEIETDGENEGSAYGLEARISLTDFRPQSRQLDAAIWTRRTEAGFSTANTELNVDTTESGIELISKPTERIQLLARAQRVDEEGERIETEVAGQIDFHAFDRLTASAELRNIQEDNLVTDTDGESTVIAGKLSFDATDNLNVYGIQQNTISHSGSQSSNDLTTVGASFSASNRLNLSGELSAGERGNSALAGVEIALSDTFSVYSNYNYSFSDTNEARNSIVLGQRKTLSSQLKVYTEHQFSDEDERSGYAHTIGLDQQLTEYASIGLSFQRAAINDDNSEDIDRNTLSTNFAFQKDRFRFNSTLEFRRDEGVNIDLLQWVSTSRFEYRRSASLRWQGRVNVSRTDDRSGSDDARFTEASFGFALRPVSNDRLNMLGRVTFLRDLLPLSQSTGSDTRSIITSIEGLYDITRLWSAGGKAAHRGSEIRLERDTGPWIDNDASLLSARVRYKARFGIDASASYHWLFSDATDGTRHGTLLTVGRRVGDNLTFSIGYNFTSFDDNLTNDSFDSNGWFLNLIGTY